MRFLTPIAVARPAIIVGAPLSANTAFADSGRILAFNSKETRGELPVLFSAQEETEKTEVFGCCFVPFLCLLLFKKV